MKFNLYNINNQSKSIRLLIGLGALLFLSGCWLDASAHTYIGGDLNSFFTPWHAVLYSGYVILTISILLEKYISKNSSWDMGFLGITIFGIGGVSDAIWHTILGIEEGIEALISPSHLFLFIGGFLMLAHIIASQPSKKSLDFSTIISIASIYSLIMFITQFMNPFLSVYEFFFTDWKQELAAGSLFFQALLTNIVFLYILKFNISKKQIVIIYLTSFLLLSIHALLGDQNKMILIILTGFIYSVILIPILHWFFQTKNPLKIQISGALIAATYGGILILYIFISSQFFWETLEIKWRFYGLGGLIFMPGLFGFLIGNLYSKNS
ncbi:MAG: hypothetical protein FI687_05725 [SAR202 cluster bacterium]|nr:hypothetical protein [SAR202 cluster bacterium]|tara:strand:+ start:35099 stop:36070 length:972 start_codon:yes stop_codon:yes gene_type:complete